MKPKHFLITLLALLTSITASAANTWTDANGTIWKFTISGSYATLGDNMGGVAISGNIPETLTIPSLVYKDQISYTVKSIGDLAFNSQYNITSVIIPDEVTVINSGAFRYCTSLTSITLSTNLFSIAGYVFDNCSSLSSINIPEGVTSIGNGAFQNCI